MRKCCEHRPPKEWRAICAFVYIVHFSQNECPWPIYPTSTSFSTYWTPIDPSWPNLHDPTYMTAWGKTFFLWLPKFLVSSPLHCALLVFLVHVPTASSELGIQRGWAYILFIFVPSRPSSLNHSSVNIYGRAIFGLHSEVMLQCRCFWALSFISFIYLLIYSLKIV